MSATTVAGLLLVALPLAFNAAFALLAARFEYPEILRRPTAELLAASRAGGTSLVLLWWAFALTAVLLAPAAVLLSGAIPDADATLLSVASTVGVPAALVRSSAWSGGRSWCRTWPGSPATRTPAPPGARRSVSSLSPSTATSAWPSASASATCSPEPGRPLRTPP